MGKLLKIQNRFYFLAESLAEKNKINLKWDDTKKAFYTEDFIQARKLSNYIKDTETKKYFDYLDSNYNGSKAEEPETSMRKIEGIYGFQARGIQEITMRLHQYKSVLLADEQGLGKTIQVIKIIQDIEHQFSTYYPKNYLIICPASLKLNWHKEKQQWYNRKDDKYLPVQIIKTSKDYIDPASRIVIVNYDLLTKEHIQSQINKTKFYLCITDEAHYLKTAKAARTKAALKIMRNIQYNIALTGTPVLNKPIELYSLLKCLKVTDILKPYDTYRPYAFRYCNAYDGKWGFDVNGASNTEELNYRLRSTIMVRREKKDVLKQLPDKSYQIIPLEMDAAAKKVSDSLNKLDIEKIKKNPELGSAGEIAKLRHELALAKLDDSISYIKALMDMKDKLVVFAHHRAVIAELADKLKAYNPVVFDGSTSIVNKNKAVEAFQQDVSCRIFIGQVQSAGVGITLTAADMVVFVESSWVPGEVEQAVDRCHRIGQKNNVLAQFLTVSGSIDEIMLNAVIKKKDIINQIMK